MSAPIELDGDRLRALLAELDQRLAQRGISAGLYVVGGAAIALTISERRLTLDVDALATDQAVYDEAAIIARQHGLPPTWLNPSAAPWIPPRARRRHPRNGSRRSSRRRPQRRSPPPCAGHPEDRPALPSLVNEAGSAARFLGEARRQSGGGRCAPAATRAPTTSRRHVVVRGAPTTCRRPPGRCGSPAAPGPTTASLHADH